MTLTAKTALVTGSTSGIGLGVARALAGEGANVVLNGFGDPDEIEALRQEIASTYGVPVIYDDANLSVASEVARLVTRAGEHFNGLDILVNNAGIQHVAPIESFDDERWDAVIALNLSAVFHAMKAAIPLMKRQGWGRIINVASAHGLVASPFKVAYVAAKHGVVGATKVAALELANEAITVNAICPGWVLTPLVERQLADRASAHGTDVTSEATKLLQEKQPMLSFTTPDAIGAMAVYLCSDAARTLTGAALSIDGGWVAQ
ncbi:MAG TPA: 3-hydroxybutyrate dehydrogenase [Acidimicrobiales bacterium]|nr:MAG: 3-hydroxybutyrate dehydrogenase [Actinobacteria bacterium 21-64-8]HQT99185.1 3-hydroxybutyrate dehydrogenase [Acidimicrobiales bacterium]